MSTRLTIDYNVHLTDISDTSHNDHACPAFRLCEESLDSSKDVYLTLPGGEFEASNEEVTVRIPRAVWNRLIGVGPRYETGKDGRLVRRCPLCKEVAMSVVTRDETFEFNTGRGVVNVKAERVRVEVCSACKEEISGPAAATRRADAIARAVLDLLHKLVPEPTQTT